MTFSRFAVVAVLLLTTLCLGACGAKDTNVDPDSGEFAWGAFPPVLTDTDYHDLAWTKPGCLLCHDKGEQGAPKTVHKGMPEYLKQAKCRTCHVLIKGLQPSGD